MANCNLFAPGTIGDTSGNTLGCRYHYALFAANASALNCEPAGPSGGSECGADPCDQYCTIMTAQCPTAYASRDECMQTCATFATDSRSYGEGVTTGNTKYCHLTHAVLAAYEPLTHCTDAGPSSTPCQ